MAVLVGQIVGGIIIIFVLAWAWERILFQRVIDEPATGKVMSVIAAWLTTGTLGGFGMADGGPYHWQAFALYAVSALPVGLYAHYQGSQLRYDADA